MCEETYNIKHKSERRFSESFEIQKILSSFLVPSKGTHPPAVSVELKSSASVLPDRACCAKYRDKGCQNVARAFLDTNDASRTR